MPLLDAFVTEPLLVNEPIIDSLCLEAGCLEVFLANSEEAGSGTACATRMGLPMRPDLMS